MRKVKMQKREHDMFTGRPDLEPLYTFKDFPVYCGAADLSDGGVETDICADMKWMISAGSGMIQLGELVPIELLYSKSHNASVGGTWKSHHKEFADFLHRYADGTIIEIGGGNGILNSIYNTKYGTVKWIIVDPTTVRVTNGCNARYIQTTWTKDLDLKNQGIDCGTLVHSHLMEHQYDLREFMKLNADKLKTGQCMVFSVPDLKMWLRRKYSNALFFEHTYLITEEYIDIILHEFGFQILQKKYFGNGHSIFYAAERTEKVHPVIQADYKVMYDANKRAFLDYVEYNKAIVERANRFIDSSAERTWLFGGHIFSQYLINNGLHVERIKGILDNDEQKQGKRLYGTNLKIFSPKILKKEKNPKLILNAGAYTEEIKKDILKNINPCTIIME